ncbi:MAG: hypothetical protein M3Y44_07575 [Actinomycetota bacterium]|nr:hypothetical protein [Actinomycetota bacterium]
MTRTDSDRTLIEVGSKPRPDGIRVAGGICTLGALVLCAGGVATQIAQASTKVSDQLWRYPWTSHTAAIAWPLFGTMEMLVLVGVLGWWRSGAAGSGRAARAGLPLTAIGTAAIVAGHFASLAVRNESIDDTSAQLVGGIFAAGAVVSAVGLALAGWATLRAGVWSNSARFVPFSLAVVTAALAGLGPTKAFPTAIAGYSLGFAALGIALMREGQARRHHK